MSLPPDLDPAVAVVVEVIRRRIPSGQESEDHAAATDVVERLLHGGWLQIPTSSAVPLLDEASPDMDSGGAG
jgi:hypothetical protein